MNCPVCRSDQTGRTIAKGTWSYRLCSRCGHGWLDPQPPGEVLEQTYDENYFVASTSGGYADYLRDEKLHRLNARSRLRLLSLPSDENRRLIDIGCAAGFFLDEARRSGWSVAGVDRSPWARRTASEKLGIDVFASLDEAIGVNESATLPAAITLFQVLEHVPDPAAALQEIFERLAPGGRLVVETWNRESTIARLCGSNWQQLTPPSVLTLFSNRSLRQMVSSAGFAEIVIRSTGKKVSAGFVGNLLAEKHPRLLAPLGWVTSLPVVRDIAATYALGDLVTLVALKPVTR